MTSLHALILGLVEGISEFLPISSTAHLMFASSLLGLAQSEFVKTFEIAIQSGAILAVAVLYYKSFLNIEKLKRIIVAFVPTGIIGLALYGVVKTYLLGNIPVALGALFLGGIALIIFERKRAPYTDEGITRLLTYKEALIVGVAQSVAIIPGVSRSAATIVGGMLAGIDRKTIVEFSFLLAAPTMAAATALDLLKHGKEFTSADYTSLAIGFVMSFVVAIASMRWLLKYVRTHNFVAFGIYRIVAAILFALILLR